MSSTISHQQLRDAFSLAADHLKLHTETLNHLNLFPVADKDTGINMARSLEKTAAHLTVTGTPAQVAEDAYMQLLEYACGNSGTILTLFFEGFAYGLPAEAETISGHQLADAYMKGAENALNGVSEPMNGTILSVAMQSARAGVSLTEITDDAGQVFFRITEEAHASLMQTAQQNPLLRPYHVVDSGAYGFCLILDAFLKSFAPDCPAVPYGTLHLPDALHSQELEQELLQRFCVELVFEPFDCADLNLLDSQLHGLGDCYLHAGTSQLRKIHIHTNEPDRVYQIVSEFGTVRTQKTDDMQAGL